MFPLPFPENVFYQTALLLFASALVGAVALRLRQPLIVAFIAVGILAGPSAFGWTGEQLPLRLLAQLGIALLLFLVGLKLDLGLIRSLGRVALATGLGQVLFTSAVGYLLCRLLELPPLTSLYVAVALTFSSTIIIVKLLSDKREIDALHGRIAVGFLIVQDVVVILVMIVLSSVGAGGDGDALWMAAIGTLLAGSGFLLALGLVMRFVLPALLRRLAQSRELLVLFAIAWAVALAAVGERVGLSTEVGAFLAGVSLASTPYREAIGARLVSLRDFLLLFFFIELGSHLDLGLLGTQLRAAVVLSFFVLLGNPLIVMVIMGVMGYRKRTSFLAGLTVAQISEFSLILAALGMTLGHIDAEAMGLVTLVGLVTIGLSTYLILYSHPLFDRLAPMLSVFERRSAHAEQRLDGGQAARVDVVLFGLGRYGHNIGLGLIDRGLGVLGVDFDPVALQAWRDRGHVGCYGDAEDPEFPASLPLAGVSWVVSTAPETDTNLTLLHALRAHGFTGRVAVTTHRQHDVRRLERSGAHLVLLPYVDAARHAVERLTEPQPPN